MKPLPESFPDESGHDVTDGLWFVFELPDVTIRTWGGAMGLERVFVDEALVSEHRSFRLLSVHDFRIGEDAYQIVHKIPLRGDSALDCSLIRNGEVQQMQQVKYRKPGESSGHVWRVVLVGVFLGLLMSTFDWPVWMPFVVCAVILGVRRSKRAIRRRVVIEPAP